MGSRSALYGKWGSARRSSSSPCESRPGTPVNKLGSAVVSTCMLVVGEACGERHGFSYLRSAVVSTCMQGVGHPGSSTPASGCAPTASTPTCRADSHAHRTCGEARAPWWAHACRAGARARSPHAPVHRNHGSSVAIIAHQSQSGLISRNQGSSVAIRAHQSHAPVHHKLVLARPSVSLSLEALQLGLWGGQGAVVSVCMQVRAPS